MSLYSGKPCCLACYRKWSTLDALVWRGLSLDVDCLDAAFVPETGWPELLAAPWSTVTSFLKDNKVYTPQGLFGHIPSILPEKPALRMDYRLLPHCPLVSD